MMSTMDSLMPSILPDSPGTASASSARRPFSKEAL